MKRPLNILVTDRNPNVRRLLYREMTAQGYRVVLAKNGNEISDSLDHNKIDLVVLDPELAYMSDFSLSRKLKNKLNGMPVIIHSFGNGDNRHEEISNKTLFVEKGSRSVERIKQEAKKLLERA